MKPQMSTENADKRKINFYEWMCAFVFVLLFVSTCFATLTIYYKDGTSRDVHKITFKGKAAELYLIDGSVITVPVEKLDLRSSGIGAAVGTYGTSKVTGERTAAERKGVLGSPLRQARLREEWERAEKSATVLSSIGPMQRGDTVKIVAETMANNQPAADDSYDEGEYWYDPKYRGYRFKAKDLDHAYVLIYKNQDGTYGKRLLDAVTFNSHFQLSVAAKAPATRMPEYPVIPDQKDPDIHDPNPFSTSRPKTETSDRPLEQPAPGGEAQEVVSSNESPASSSGEANEMQKSSRRRSWIAYLIFLSVLAALGFGAWLLIVRNQRPYIDTSKFRRYEEDLREFEIAIWLRNGKTADQLMEICLKKFYQDRPSVLTVCNKILKGNQKGLTVPFISKQTGRSIVEAERIYDDIQNQIERIRNLIREVAVQTGISPAKPAVEVTQKPAVAEMPRSASAPKTSVPSPPPLPPKQVATPVSQQPGPMIGNDTSSVSLNAPAPGDGPSSGRLIEPDAPMRTASDLPQYASNVLNQISFLSSPEEK
jgi:hypothetical protein